MQQQHKIYQIFLIDDHPSIRSGYWQLFEREPDLHVCGEAAAGNEALELLRQKEPDVIVLDLVMPGRDGIELIKNIRQLRPNLAILVVSAQDELARAMKSLQAGANGYVEKMNVRHLVEAIRVVANGGRYLSQRMKELTEQ